MQPVHVDRYKQGIPQVSCIPNPHDMDGDSTAEPQLQMTNESIRSLVCDACWGHFFSFQGFQTALASEKDTDSTGFSYDTTWEAIRESASKNCNWCKLLSSPAENGTGPCTVTITFSTEEEGYTPAGVKKLTIRYRGKDGTPPIGERSYRLYTSNGDIAGEIIRPRERVLDISAPSSYKLGLESLNHCIQHHDQCPKPAETALPDRVIDCSDLEHPRIVLTNNIKGAYATLSYVWGRRQTVRLTTENVDSFVKNGFDLKEFPLTIRDAVTVAHNLGMKYLWIDILCILQDSDSDKGLQMSKMNKIYSNAYFTIIAASASVVDDGFLEDRPARIPSSHIPFVCPDGRVGSVFLASTDMVGYDVTQMYHDELEPISSRGWCLQERVLSQRSFIYAADTLKYNCQTEVVNIGNAFCEPTTGPRLPKAFTFNISPVLSPEQKILARQSWLFIMWEYTRRDLSRPDDDRLNALGGIAEQYSYVWKSKYFGGIWENTIHEDLLWHLGNVGSGPVPRPKVYRGPSWSWASVDGPVEVPNTESLFKSGGNNIGKCTVVHCEVTSAHPESPFAAVKNGHLKLEAFVHEVTIDVAAYEKRNRKAFMGSHLESLREADYLGLITSDSTENLPGRQAWIVPILWDQEGFRWIKAIAVVGAGEGVFRRVGLFYPEGDMNWVEKGTRKVITII